MFSVFAPVGSKAQHWHVDDAFDNSRVVLHRYFTILIHLNPIDAFCGGTEIWSEALQRGDMVLILLLIIYMLRIFIRIFIGFDRSERDPEMR